MRRSVLIILCLSSLIFSLARGQVMDAAQVLDLVKKSRQTSDASANNILREREVLKKFQKYQRSPEEQLQNDLIRRLQKNDTQMRTGGNVSGGGNDYIPFTGTTEDAEVIKAYQKRLLGIEQYPVVMSDKKIRIAILDSGLSAESAVASKVFKFIDFTSRCSAQTFCDESLHGSLVADLVSQAAPHHSLIILKTLSEGASGHFQHLLSALQWLLKNYESLNIRVVNLSLTSPERMSGTWNEVDQARQLVRKLDEKGVVVVSAVGNDFQKNISLFPASSPHALVVGSYAHSFSQNPDFFKVSLFSNVGYAENPRIEHSQFLGFQSTSRNFNSWVFKPDVLAPGENILTCLTPTSCQFVSGTSFAAALVTGRVASTLEDDPSLARDTLMRKIRSRSCQSPFVTGNWDKSKACALRFDSL